MRVVTRERDALLVATRSASVAGISKLRGARSLRADARLNAFLR